MDDDRWALSGRNSWRCPFDFILNGKYPDVLRHSMLSVSAEPLKCWFFFSCKLFHPISNLIIVRSSIPFAHSDLSDFLGGAYAIQYFFAGVSIVAFFFGLLFLPETHGKKLSEIEAYFKGKSNKKPKANGTKKVLNNRKPKQPVFKLQTVNESEKMMNGSDNVWRRLQRVRNQFIVLASANPENLEKLSACKTTKISEKKCFFSSEHFSWKRVAGKSS